MTLFKSESRLRLRRPYARGGWVRPRAASDDSVAAWLADGELWYGPRDDLDAKALSRHIAGIERIRDRLKVLTL